jgi:hypothetical protein
MIAFEAITFVPPLFIELRHLSMLAEEGSRGQALEKLALLNGFGNTLRDDCTVSNSFGEAVVANVINRPFLVELAVGLLEYFLSVKLSLDLERLSEGHMHHFLNGYYDCKYYKNLNEIKLLHRRKANV